MSFRRARRWLAQRRGRGRDSIVGNLIALQGWWLVPALLALVTFVALLPTLQNGFVDWDDTSNLVENADYRGLRWTQLRWMFTTFLLGHWIPLTWLTFGLDYVLWGMNPVGYHLTNLLLHAANAVVFYLIAARLLALAGSSGTQDVGARLGASVAALLFAVHPLRVESVAWATERRDVLCALFYLLAILAYLGAWQAAAGGSLEPEPRYWASLGLFALALLSKPMAVSLPAVLLALDAYPLRRFGGGPGGGLGPAGWRVAIEKAPFALLSLAVSVVALFALNHIKGIKPIVTLGWLGRVAISLYSLAFYLWKSLVPLHLSPLYELPDRIDPLAWPYLMAAAVVGGVTAAAIALRRRWPALLAVWVSYVVILLPVLGIVQNGPQIAADRYTYLASLGWTLLVGSVVRHWWMAERERSAGDHGAVVLAVVLVAFIGGLGTLTWKQAHVWRDSGTLWAHAASAAPSSLAYSNVAALLVSQGRLREAVEYFRRALSIRPGDAEARNNLGAALAMQGQLPEAVEHLREALRLQPGLARAHNNLGTALAAQGQLPEAVEHFREALRLRPDFPEARRNLERITTAAGSPAR